jgi:hypothetical protein
VYTGGPYRSVGEGDSGGGGNGMSGDVDWNLGMRDVTIPCFIPSGFVEVIYE